MRNKPSCTGVLVCLLLQLLLIDAATTNVRRIAPDSRHLTEGTWVTITYDDFENGWGNFQKIPGAPDATIADSGSYAHQGTKSLRIRDNSGERSSAYHKDDHDLSTYSDVKVEFWFYAYSMEANEDFFLEYSPDGGNTWTIVKQYLRNRDFNNRRFVKSTVSLSDCLQCDLDSTQARLRFRCDASSNGDKIYIDEVSFKGFVPAADETPSATPSSMPSFVPSATPSSMPSTVPSAAPSAMPSTSSMPSTVPSASPTGDIVSADQICPEDRLNPPKKYQVLPFVDADPNDNVEDDLSEISALAFSNQTDANGNRYAYVVSDKEQFSVKVIQFQDNIFDRSTFSGEGEVVVNYTLNVPYGNDDWEDISLGPCTDSSENSYYAVGDTCIYVANTGNNARSGYQQRTELKIFKFVEPDISALPPLDEPFDVATIVFQYDSANGFTGSTYDSEAMFVDWKGMENSNTEKEGDVYIVTKGGCGGGVGKIPVSVHKNLAPGETMATPYLMAKLMNPPSQGIITCSTSPFRVWQGADMRRDGRLISMIRGGPPASVYFYPRLPDQSVVQALSNGSCPYVSSTSYGLEDEKKHEAVAFVDAEGSRFADASECQEGDDCTVPVYFYELEYPYSITPRIDEPTTGWERISEDTFVSGQWGSFVSGGSNALMKSATGCNGPCHCVGTHAVEISEGLGKASSFYHREDKQVDYFGYKYLRITFQFKFRGYDHMDSFFAEISLDGGENYFIVGDWAQDVDEYIAGECSSGHILLTKEKLGVPQFGNNVRLRFRNSANAEGDRAYIDNILFEGHV